MRAKYIRSVIGEMERIHSHLLWIGVAAHEIGFDTLLMYTWRDREIIMDLLAMLTGNRVNYAVNVIGGVRKDIEESEKEQILKAVDALEERKYCPEPIHIPGKKSDAHATLLRLASRPVAVSSMRT